MARHPRTPPPSLPRLASAVALVLVLGGCASALERARVARDARDYPKAEQYYRTSMSADPEDRAAAQTELAGLKVTLAQQKLKSDPAAAEQLFRAAGELAPADEKALDGLGRALADQGKEDEAITVLAGGEKPCTLCRRLLTALLMERAPKREQAGDVAGARADYVQAQALVPDASLALAIARIDQGAGDPETTFTSAEAAVPLIREADTGSQEQFKALREQAVMAAAQRGDVALVDRWMNLFPPGAGGDDWYLLQLRVVQQLRLENRGELAITRARQMLGAKYANTLPPARKADFEKLLADFHRVQGVAFLRAGKLVEADDNFRQAMELAPEDNKIKLLRALAIAGTLNVGKAMQVVQALPKDTRGYNEVMAILESMLVHDRLAEEDLEGAKAALARAQAMSSEQPEVHVAMAELLFVSPVENLPRGAAREVKKFGSVKYPNDEINRYGEALSELAWAREQARGLGEGYMFRGPGIDGRMANLERQIRSFYPYAVEFNADSTTILRLKGASGEVKLRGPGGLDETVVLAPGAVREVVVREQGVVTLRIGKRTVALVAEPYTKLLLEL
jgi:tetratricopeptide (TPR) repeat protein